MTSFSDREKAFESMFAHDQEMRFKAEARANRLLGIWAAELLGITGPEAENYAKAVVVADVEEPGHEDVFRKVRDDFDSKNVNISDEELRSKMLELAAVAIEQVRNE